MTAIAEATVAKVGTKFGESQKNVFVMQMRQSKDLQPGDINHGTLGICLIGLHGCCGVATRIQKARDLADGGLGIRHQRIDSRGFTHTRLTGKNSASP